VPPTQHARRHERGGIVPVGGLSRGANALGEGKEPRQPSPHAMANTTARTVEDKQGWDLGAACRPDRVHRPSRRLPRMFRAGGTVMGWIRKPRSGRGWEARYRGADGKERSRSFSTKRRAQEFLATVETEKHRGDWRDPALARTSLGEWATEWEQTTV